MPPIRSFGFPIGSRGPSLSTVKRKGGLLKPNDVRFEQSRRKEVFCSIQSLNNRAVDRETGAAERRSSRKRQRPSAAYLTPTVAIPRGRTSVGLLKGIVGRVSLSRPSSPIVSECSTLPSPAGTEAVVRGERT